MGNKLNVIFFGELESYFSRAHYLALGETEILIWVASHDPREGAISPRKPFRSFRDGWERVRMRSQFELQTMRHLGRPMALMGSPNCRVQFTFRDDPHLAGLLRQLKPDVIVSAGFRKILPPPILEIPRLGAFNCHPAPLPRYAGSNPWFWILRNGERESGVTIHRMVADADAGDIVAQERFDLEPSINYQQLYNRSTIASAVLLKESARLWQHEIVNAAPQDLTLRTYFPAPRDPDYRIDWSSSAEEIENLVRAATPAPGAWTSIHGRRFTVLRAARADKCKETAGRIARIDKEGLCVACGDGAIWVRGVALEIRAVPIPHIIQALHISVGDQLE